MEISNNLIPTLSVVDSPNPPSEENPQVAKNAKKKVPGEESSFDGALAAIARPQPQVLDLGKVNVAEVTDQVDLSKQAKDSAVKAAKAEASPTPNIASLFQAKAEQSARGPMANAFVAGPDQPWGSRWVFSGGNQPAPEEIEAVRTSGGKPTPLTNQGTLSLDQLKKLVEQVKAQGGDETQLKQAAEATLKNVDSAIAALGGEIEGVRTNVTVPADSEGNPVKVAPTVLGGAEYLSTLQSAKAASASNPSALGRATGSLRGPTASVKTEAVGSTAIEPRSIPNVAPTVVGKPELQVITGGLALGEKRMAKEEPKLQTDTFYPNGMPLAAANPQSDKLGAGVVPTITGHVVPGAMMRERLTSESLRNVANGIVGMSGGTGGEMRIRLNPGNLGELMIRVSTNGKEVGLKVQANDPGAKKIIEESLGALRDSLAQQNLSLGRVDVTLASAATNSTDLNGQNSQSGTNGHPAFGSFDGQPSANQGRFMDGSNSREDRASRSSESESDRAISRHASARIAAMSSSGRSDRSVDSTRLDVMA